MKRSRRREARRDRGVRRRVGLAIFALALSVSALPVVAKMLELSELEAYIAQHALPVDVDLGILFTLGRYGDQAVPHAMKMLDHPECAGRANAATASPIQGSESS